MKFDTMDFSQLALDIIKIQVLTADLSIFVRSFVFSLKIKNHVIFTIYGTLIISSKNTNGFQHLIQLFELYSTPAMLDHSTKTPIRTFNH